MVFRSEAGKSGSHITEKLTSRWNDVTAVRNLTLVTVRVRQFRETASGLSRRVAELEIFNQLIQKGLIK